MQRFFCTICGKVKRVQHLPSNVVDAYSDTPEMRKGTCNSHDAGFRRNQSVKTVVNTQKSRKVS